MSINMGIVPLASSIGPATLPTTISSIALIDSSISPLVERATLSPIPHRHQRQTAYIDRRRQAVGDDNKIAVGSDSTISRYKVERLYCHLQKQ